MALDAYQNGKYSLCLRLLHLQNQQQQLSVQHRQLQIMAQIGHLLKTHSTTIALTAAWASLLGISLLSSTTTTTAPPPSPSFIRSQHRKLAALLHPDKNHHKDASIRFTQLQQGVETVLKYLSSSSTGGGGASQSFQHYDTNNNDGDDQELDDTWVIDNNGGNFPWWSRWDDDDRDREEKRAGEREEQEEEEDMSYLKSLTHEELKQEVAKRREIVVFDSSKAMHSRLERGRAVLTNVLQQTGKESEQQQYGGFFPSF